MDQQIVSVEEIMAKKDRASSRAIERAALEYLLIKDVNLHSCLEDGGTAALRAAFFSLSSKITPTVFCEVGAHDGATAADFKRTHPSCRVFSFEANPKIHAAFSDRHRDTGVDYRNIAIDKSSGTVKVFAPTTASKLYVGDGFIETTFTEPANTGRTSLLMRDEEATYDEFVVDSLTLDDFLKNTGCTISDENIVLWIDVEGAAHRVLKGARRALVQTSIIFIEMETAKFWKGQRDAVYLSSVLVKHGFVPVARDREYGDRQFNALFVSIDHLEHVERELFDLGSSLRSCMGPRS